MTYVKVNWNPQTSPGNATSAFRKALAQSNTIFVPDLDQPYPIEFLEISAGQTILCESRTTAIVGVNPWSTLLTNNRKPIYTPFRIQGGTWSHCGRVIEVAGYTFLGGIFEGMGLNEIRGFSGLRLTVEVSRPGLALGNLVVGQRSGAVGQVVGDWLSEGILDVVPLTETAFGRGEEIEEATGTWKSPKILRLGGRARIAVIEPHQFDGTAFRLTDALGCVWRDIRTVGKVQGDQVAYLGTELVIGFVGAGQSNGNLIENCYFEAVLANAIAVEPVVSATVNNLTIRDCVFQNVNESAISISGVSRVVRVQGCYFELCGDADHPDIEILASANMASWLVEIDGNHFGTPKATQNERVKNTGNTGYTARNNHVVLGDTLTHFATVAGARVQEVRFDNNLVAPSVFSDATEILFQRAGGSGQNVNHALSLTRGSTMIGGAHAPLAVRDGRTITRIYGLGNESEPSVIYGHLYTLERAGNDPLLPISNLTGGVAGQTVTLIGGTRDRTVVHGHEIRLADGRDFPMRLGDTLSLLFVDQRQLSWVEVSRSRNG